MFITLLYSLFILHFSKLSFITLILLVSAIPFNRSISVREILDRLTRNNSLFYNMIRIRYKAYFFVAMAKWEKGALGEIGIYEPPTHI